MEDFGYAEGEVTKGHSLEGLRIGLPAKFNYPFLTTGATGMEMLT